MDTDSDAQTANAGDFNFECAVDGELGYIVTNHSTTLYYVKDVVCNLRWKSLLQPRYNSLNETDKYWLSLLFAPF